VGQETGQLKTKIVVVSDSMPPWNFGGKEERLRRFKEDHDGLDDFEILYCTMQWWEGSQTPANHFALTKKHSLYTKKNRRSIRQSLLFTLGCLKIIRLKPDIIEADAIPILPLFTLKIVSVITGAHLSVTCHEFWSVNTWIEYFNHNKTLGRLASFLERSALSLCDSVIAVSSETLNLLKQDSKLSRKTQLIENRIDANAINHAKTDLPASDLLFVGRFIENKKISILLEALAIVIGNGVEIKLTLVGEGPDSENLYTHVKNLGLEKNVIFFETIFYKRRSCNLGS
jgi:glycosyltransferase involved in cell wall biosynthesis